MKKDNCELARAAGGISTWKLTLIGSIHAG